MLERTIKESWTLEDVAELKSGLSRLRRDSNSVNRPFYEHCKVWVEDAELRRKAAKSGKESIGEMGISEDFEELPFGQGDFGYQFNMKGALKTLSEKELFKRVICSMCADVPVEAMKTDVSVFRLLLTCFSQLELTLG
jgi:hypothetical protein